MMILLYSPFDHVYQNVGGHMNPIKRDNEKVYIEGVRKVTWDSGEMCEFASAFTSALSCLGDEVPYYQVLGTSGVAFRFTLNPGEWDFGNYSVRNISAEPYEPVRRAVEAAGHAYSIHEKGQMGVDAANIMESITAWQNHSSGRQH
jgi:hypothetical protein